MGIFIEWFKLFFKAKLEIKIKYFDQEMPKIEKIEIGDWIDLRTSSDVNLKKGESMLIPLGVAIKLPYGYEAHLAPRGSTYSKYNIIQTNSVGIIDESYCGDNDQWFMPVYATKESKIEKYSRICQFRIVKKMDKVNIVEVNNLDNPDRGGHGSTGEK